MLNNPRPPGYTLTSPRGKPRLGTFVAQIEAMLSENDAAPPKQRQNGRRIFERLRDEHGYTGCESQVRTLVAKLKGARPKEPFIPLTDLPGEAQADFYEAVVKIGEERLKAHFFLMVLPHSDVYFQVAYPAENTESFLDGHARAFSFFGGIPRRCVYDNAGYAVKPGSGPLTGRERELTQGMLELRSTCLLETEFARPAKGNEKGSVERKVQTLRSSLLSPVPNVGSWEELNARLLAKALERKRQAATFSEDAGRLLPLADYRPCRLTSAKADKLSLVRFEGANYSVPTKFAGRELLVRATPFEVRLLSGRETVATHPRNYSRGGVEMKLEHYLDALELKPRAVRNATPVIQAGLPEEFESYRLRAEKDGAAGDRRFVAVLRMAAEFGVSRVANALARANAVGFKEPSDIRLMMMRESEAPAAGLCTPWTAPEGRVSVAPLVERPPLKDYEGLLCGSAL
jgi:transposase